MNMGKKWTMIFLMIWMIFVFLFFLQAGDRINRKVLETGDGDWVVHEGTDIVTMYSDKWLMYFLHWRPLTEERKNLSIGYVKKLLLSFWGPEMPFEIVGDGGETKVGSHRAFFVDGTIYNGKIHTRFIVWNCHHTGRQFIADCNINRAVGTPKRLLDLQFKITGTISCHRNEAGVADRELSRRYEAEEFQLSFLVPGNWRTEPFPSSKWFPGGMSLTNGSLWTLLTDSRKIIVLKKIKSLKKLDADICRTLLQELSGTGISTGHREVEMKLAGIHVDQVNKKAGCYELRGTCGVHVSHRETVAENDFLFRAFIRNDPLCTRIILGGMVMEKEIWKRPFDLTPGREIMDDFFTRTVFPATGFSPTGE